MLQCFSFDISSLILKQLCSPSDNATVYQPLPDLSVSEVSFSPATLAPGDTLTFNFQVNNDGTGNSPFESTYVIAYLEELGPTEGALFETQFSGLVGGDPRLYENEKVIIPNDLPAGTYHVSFEVDPGNVIEESDEDNTLTFNATPITVIDTTPPTSNSFSINSGASHTNTMGVTLTLASTGASQMRFKIESGGTWTSYER